MRRLVLGILLFGPMLSPHPRLAAQAPQGAPPASAGRGGGMLAMMDVATARKVVDAAKAAAASGNARVAIAVVDGNGDLILLERMDGVTGRGVTSAQGKARAAILFGMPTKDVADAAAAGKALSTTPMPSGVGASEVTIQQGGLPIVKDGKVVGGVGVGGSSPANDETFAQAGVAAIK